MTDISVPDLHRVLPFTLDLDEPLRRTLLPEPLMAGDAFPLLLRLTFLRGGEGPIDMRQTGLQAYMLRADGTTLVISDGVTTLQGAELSLPESALAVPGRFTLTVKITKGDLRRTVLWLEGAVAVSRTDELRDPGDQVPTLETLLAQIDEVEVAITNAAMGASRAISAATSANTAANRVLAAPFTAFADDEAVRPDRGWSSEQITRALCPLLSETGDSVTLPLALPGCPLSVAIALQPHQSGEGVPSPDNIRPIAPPEAPLLIHQAESYPLSLPEGFGGGTADVTGGAFLESHQLLTLSGGEEGWVFQETDGLRRFTLPLAFSAQGPCLCSHYAPGDASGNLQAAVEDGALILTDGRFGSVDSWREALIAQYAAGTPVTVCVPRAAPETTAAEPLTLIAQGSDALSAIGNTLTVRYRASPAALCTAHLTKEDTP